MSANAILVLILLLSLLAWLITALLRCDPAKYYATKQCQRWQQQPENAQRLAIFHSLYENINGAGLSKAGRRNQAEQHDPKLTYGEILPTPFVRLLEFAHPQPGEVFYDLGAGTGRAVITAALFFPFKQAIGVELLPALHERSQTLRAEYLSQCIKLAEPNNTDVRFQCADLLDCDLQDGSVIFINGTCFIGDYWTRIVEHLCQLKSGSRLLITSKSIRHPDFSLIKSMPCQMSWGWAQVSLYQRH